MSRLRRHSETSSYRDSYLDDVQNPEEEESEIVWWENYEPLHLDLVSPHTRINPSRPRPMSTNSAYEQSEYRFRQNSLESTVTHKTRGSMADDFIPSTPQFQSLRQQVYRSQLIQPIRQTTRVPIQLPQPPILPPHIPIPEVNLLRHLTPIPNFILELEATSQTSQSPSTPSNHSRGVGRDRALRDRQPLPPSYRSVVPRQSNFISQSRPRDYDLLYPHTPLPLYSHNSGCTNMDRPPPEYHIGERETGMIRAPEHGPETLTSSVPFERFGVFPSSQIQGHRRGERERQGQGRGQLRGYGGHEFQESFGLSRNENVRGDRNGKVILTTPEINRAGILAQRKRAISLRR